MLTVTIASEIPRTVMDAIEDLLDSHGADYRVGEIALDDPTKNGIGGYRKGDPETSRKAAVDVYPRTGNQRHRVLMAIADAGARGAIAYEIEVATGINYRSLTPRIGELKAGEWVQGTGRTRVGNMGAQQEILVLTDKAHLWIAKKERRRC